MFSEVGTHARYLLAAPLLVLAEIECGRQLSATVRHFVDTGMVLTGNASALTPPSHRPVGSSIPMLQKCVIVALPTLSWVVTIISLPTDHIPAWHRSSGAVPVYSLAGWWHVLVSLPLLLVLVLGWLWRLSIWTRLLWLIARLNLRLVASHPDHAAGLAFWGVGARDLHRVRWRLQPLLPDGPLKSFCSVARCPLNISSSTPACCLTLVALFIAPLLVIHAEANEHMAERHIQIRRTRLPGRQRVTRTYGSTVTRASDQPHWTSRTFQPPPICTRSPRISTRCDLSRSTSRVLSCSAAQCCCRSCRSSC